MARHRETRTLPYSAEQMFSLVADIELYPEFIPWCRAVRVRSRTSTESGEVIDVDLVVSIKAFRETLVSRVTLAPADNFIAVRYLDGPLRRLDSEWKFHQLGNGGTLVEYEVEFEFKYRLMTAFAEKFIDQVSSRIVSAFENRSKAVFGGTG